MSCLRTPQLVALVAMLLAGLCLTAGAQIYVVPGGAGDEDGSSWANAFGDLQDAMELAVDVEVDVWVAAGEYVVDSALSYPGPLAVYGGFPAEGGDWEDRNPWTNETVIRREGSGRLVSLGSGDGDVLDGFTLTGVSDLNFGSVQVRGGSTATIVNCIIRDNFAGQAAGVSVDDDATASIENCYFLNNEAEEDAGALVGRRGATIDITNTVFAGNVSDNRWGGGTVFVHGVTNINYCTFYDNISEDGNSHIIFDHWGDADVEVTNSIFWGNTPNTTSGGVAFSANTIRDEDPLFVNAESGDVSLQESSPAIDTGEAPVPATDIRGIPRPQGAAADVGAYERIYEGEPVTVPEVVIDGEWWSLEDVEAALVAAGLTVGAITQVYSDDVPEGLVMGQDPAAGSEVPEGSAVNLTISRGPAPTDMPLSGLAVILMVLAIMAAALGSKTLLQRAK